jgi:hypothetical protein
MGCGAAIPIAADNAPVLHYSFEGDIKDDSPGGLTGQELMFSFFEVQPCLMAGESQ